jgi:hypothetical protein
MASSTTLILRTLADSMFFGECTSGSTAHLKVVTKPVSGGADMMSMKKNPKPHPKVVALEHPIAILHVMKIISIALISLFVIGFFDLPFKVQVRDSAHHCCCKSAICHCKHGKKMQCALKQNQTKTFIKESAGGTFQISPSDCGAGSNPSNLPIHAKEFYLHKTRTFHNLKVLDDFIPSDPKASSLIFSARLHRPPKTAPLSIF